MTYVTGKLHGETLKLTVRNRPLTLWWQLASHAISSRVTKMVIDEVGEYKIKGKNETDHNTICLDVTISNIDRRKIVRKTDWNLRASSEKWVLFGDELVTRTEKARNILEETDKPFETRYANWFHELNTAALKTIGKTTFKEGGKEKFSHEVKELRDIKKTIKADIKTEREYDTKGDLIKKYKEVQEKITTQINKEKKEIMKQKLQKIASDKTKTSFWKEKKKMTRNPALEALTIKDQKG